MYADLCPVLQSCVVTITIFSHHLSFTLVQGKYDPSTENNAEAAKSMYEKGYKY